MMSPATRGPALEFLRNLTPQVMLLVLIRMIGHTLEFCTFNIDNWPVTTVYFGLCALLLYAAVANALNLLEGISPSIRHVERVGAKMQSSRHRLGKRLSIICAAAKKRKYKILSESVVFWLVLNVAALAVLITASLTAQSFIKPTKPEVQRVQPASIPGESLCRRMLGRS